MHIVFTADTHLQHKYLQDLANKAIQFQADIILHGGDLLDIYERGSYPIKTQLEHNAILLSAIRKHIPLIVCQGNHDIDSCIPTKDWENWQQGYESDTLKVTTLHYNEPSNIHKAKLAKPSNKRWVILCHEPPTKTKVGGKGGSSTSRRIIEELQPDFFLCGHHHMAPFLKGGSIWDTIGNTTVLNPGKRRDKPPNCFYINTDTRTFLYNRFGPKDFRV